MSYLVVANKVQQSADMLIEGNLVCPDRFCNQEYPVIDGIPVIVNNIKKYINDNFYYLTVRDDLSSLVASMLGDVAGPGSAFNNMRHFLSTYAWDHYGDKAPAGELGAGYQDITPGNAVRCLQAGLSLLEQVPKTPAIDIGCAVGRTTFELAAQLNGLVLGVDMGFPILRVAQQVLREGRISFPLKRVGIVFDHYEFEINMDNNQYVDFWACDAQALPFADESFGFASGLNVIDTVAAPRKVLVSINDVLANKGKAILSSPYDWSPPTPVQAWIGGFGQRNHHEGDSDAALKALLGGDISPRNTGGLSIIGEIANHRWDVRVHNRRSVRYDTHIVACEKNFPDDC
ncbi:MAG: methyltransferase domain-containing protein [Gammaproteobacteria bacterium]